MSHTWIKICGIRDPGTALAAVQAGADAIGLVFVEKSPRAVTLEQARAVVGVLPETVEPIGLFVDQSAAQVREMAAALGLGTVQLHGAQSPAMAASLAPLRILRAMAFDPATFAVQADQWATQCPNLEALLLDAPSVPGGLTGGSGRSLDWAALASARSTIPCRWILAGGLDPDNVAGAIERLRPEGVDVSSGVERSRGEKCPQRIAQFCAAVRAADEQRHTDKRETTR